MNRLKKQMWVKCIVMILAVASGMASIASTFLALIVGIVPELQGDRQAYERTFYGPILSSYAACLWDGMDVSDPEHVTGADALDGGNIRYTVQRQMGSYFDEAEEDGYEVIYTNDGGLTEENAVLTERYEKGAGVPRYNLSSFPWAMRGGRYLIYDNYESGAWWLNAGVESVIYSETDGLFYFVSDGRYFLIPEFRAAQFGDADAAVTYGPYYELAWEDGTFLYRESGTKEALTAETVQQWNSQGGAVRLGDGYAFFGEPVVQEEESLRISVEKGEIPDEQTYIVTEYGGVFGNMNFYVVPGAERTVYRVLMSVENEPKTGLTLKNGVADFLPEAQTLAGMLYSYSRRWGVYVSVSAVLFLLCVVFLMSAAGYRRGDDAVHLRFADRIPFGILTAVVIAAGTLAVVFAVALTDYSLRYLEVSLGLIVAGTLLPAAAAFTLVLLYGMSIAVRVKARAFWRYTLCYYIWRPISLCFRMVRENLGMFVRAGITFAVLTFAEFLVLCNYSYYSGVIVWFFLFKAVETPLLIFYLWQLDRLKEGGKRIAAGDYSQPIDTKHMFMDFKKHAENLNSVSSGIAAAVEERIKSERFRTELITNVSHDIKTPLTSIINYVDLIQKEEVTEETMKEYLAVLERQSLRLKKLIEDLMDASKASTGNVSVEMEPCDASVMLSQVVGEFTERAAANSLELIVDSPEPPVEILADGRHLWRVLDNLMSNVCKYAMPGTRVYINLEVFHGMVIMTFRNISKSRLNVSSDELMERFVRGDSSRNTEGSGLGLNIAQSLTALMDGNMAIQVDGDLFKAIVSFPEYREK